MAEQILQLVKGEHVVTCYKGNGVMPVRMDSIPAAGYENDLNYLKACTTAYMQQAIQRHKDGRAVNTITAPQIGPTHINRFYWVYSKLEPSVEWGEVCP